MTDLEFRDSKVIAFVGSSRYTVGGDNAEKDVDSYISNMVQEGTGKEDLKVTEYLDKELRVALAMRALQKSGNDVTSQIFVLSILLLESLSIVDRCLDTTVSDVDSKLVSFLKHYYETSLPVVRSLESSAWDAGSFSDLVDERLYAVLVGKMAVNQLSLDMFDDVGERFVKVLKSLGFMSLIPLTSEYAAGLEKRSEAVEVVKEKNCWTVGDLDFSSTAFRSILSDGKENSVEATVLKAAPVEELVVSDDDNWDDGSDEEDEIATTTIPDGLKNGEDQEKATPFREMTHWHSSRELHVVEEKKTSYWDLKNKQRYIAYVDSYARSLTGPVGLYGMPVIVKGGMLEEFNGIAKQDQNAKAKSATKTLPQVKAAATKGTSKKQKIIEENNARMLKITLEKATRKMDVTKRLLEKLDDDADKIDLLDETLVKVYQDLDLVLICHWYALFFLIF
jgi:hypothetical protein